MKQNRNSKILILGGGINQYPFIKAAHELGLYVILCDQDENNISMNLADRFYQVSIIDKVAVLDVAIKENIDGIISSSEPGMHSVSYVADKLRLPSISYESFLILVSKSKMKEFLKQNNFNYPKYLLVGEKYNLSEIKNLFSEWQCSVIVKPTDSSGSRGVSLVENISELETKIQKALKYSKSKNIILEEYIEQKYDFMIGGDIFVADNEVVFWGIMDSMRDLKINDYVPTGTSYPSSINETEMMQVKTAIQGVVDLLEINFGSFNIEIMYDKSQRLYINEINPRNGGNNIPEILLKATGFNFYVNMCLGACGLRYAENNTYTNKFLSTYVIHSEKDGIFKELLICEEIKDNITEVQMEKQIGDQVYRFTDATKKIGILFLSFESEDEMRRKLSQINNYVKIILE